MNFFIFIVIVMAVSGILTPIAKGVSRRIAKGGPDSAELKRLRAELEAAEQRISEAEHRLRLNEERLDFQEKLLAPRATRRDEPAPRE
ncbi:MAG: hypothetical protein WEF86_06090 [Gemmatimonadota bacterium]